MGYEVFLVKTQTNKEPFEEISQPVPFPDHQELFGCIRTRFSGLDNSDPSWVILYGEGSDDFTMELNIGKPGKPIECIMVIRPAGRDGIWAVRELCRMLQCRAWDGEGELDFENPKGWLKEALEDSDSVHRNSVLIEN